MRTRKEAIMKARGLFALCMSAALVAGACGGADNDSVLEPMDSAPASEPAAETRSAEPQADSNLAQVISGSLGEVDSQTRTFTLNTGTREEAFTFTESTQVTGASGTQGLAGREGDRVTVHYREQGGSRIADRIVLEDAAAQPQR
jgi:hypothetical protein